MTYKHQSVTKLVCLLNKKKKNTKDLNVATVFLMLNVLEVLSVPKQNLLKFREAS